MKVLFVCRSNVGRSQMAMTYYNHLTRSMDSSSAGTVVDIPNQIISERPKAANIIKLMREVGLDISQNKRAQLTEELVNSYDEIVMMAEPDTVPKYAESHSDFITWNIEDPADMNLDDTRKVRDLIFTKVEDLVAQNQTR
jgi:arsenate reductase